MRRSSIVVSQNIVCAIAMLAGLSPAHAQYALTWYTIDGGGMTFHQGGEFRLGGTTGQHDVGIHTGGDFRLIGGFWPTSPCSPPEFTQQPMSLTHSVGETATFTAGASGAPGSIAVDAVGSTANGSIGPRLRGNSYAVAQTTTLTQIEHYLNITSSGPIVFYVYEAGASAGPYTLIAQDMLADSGTGEQWYASPPMTVTLQQDRFYIIGSGWPGSHGYFWGGTHPVTTSFGETMNGFATNYQTPLPPSPMPTSGLLMYQRLTTYDSPYQWRRNGIDLNDGPSAGGGTISGATSTTLTITSVGIADAGPYDAVVSNSCGLATSDPATLSVTAGLMLLEARSVAQHTSGEFYITLDTSNSPADRTSEPRSSGLQILDFLFDQAVTSGSISVNGGPGIPMTLLDGGTRGRVNLGAAQPNEAVYTIRVMATSGARSTLDMDICAVALVGDFNDDDQVTAADKAEQAGFVFQKVSQSNAKYDVSVGGGTMINVNDVGFWIGFFGNTVVDEDCP